MTRLIDAMLAIDRRKHSALAPGDEGLVDKDVAQRLAIGFDVDAEHLMRGGWIAARTFSEGLLSGMRFTAPGSTACSPA
jgi:hypothetical protein